LSTTLYTDPEKVPAKTVTTAAQPPDTEGLEAADSLCHLPRLATAMAPRTAPINRVRRNE
jgi:hypothetical protein